MIMHPWDITLLRFLWNNELLFGIRNIAGFKYAFEMDREIGTRFAQDLAETTSDRRKW